MITHWSKDLCGAKGRVVGYDGKDIKVEITEEPRYTKEKVK